MPASRQPHRPTGSLAASWRRATVVTLLAAAGCAAAQGVGPGVGPGVSPIVTWDPDRGQISRPPTRRPLRPDETRTAQERAAAVYRLLRQAPPFSEPGDRSAYLTSWAVVDPSGLVQQDFTVYWSRPFDTRRHADGAWYGVMGGAHQLLYLRTNVDLGAQVLEERGSLESARTGPDGVAYFEQPRVFGELGGGTVYRDAIVFRRDRGSALAPAPLGALLAIEQARLERLVQDSDRSAAQSLQQLDASMTPDAVAQRRAKREAAWAKVHRNPQDLARQLDAAQRTDEADAQRQRERLLPPPQRDPRTPYWGMRHALERVKQQRAALVDPQATACAKLDPAVGTQTAINVSYEALAGAPADCVPMVRLRPDALDRRRPPDEVQMLLVYFRERICGDRWGDGPRRSADEPCNRFVGTLRALDWPSLLKTLGW